MTTKPKTKPCDKPLAWRIRNGVLTIEIGIETLAHSARHCPLLYNHDVHGGSPGPYCEITDSVELAKDVAGQLFSEKEDGSSVISDALDNAIVDAMEDGSLAFYDGDGE